MATELIGEMPTFAGPWRWLRPGVLLALGVAGVWESGDELGALVVLGVVLLLVGAMMPGRLTVTVVGLMLVAAGTPVATLFLPVLVPELFWAVGFRQSMAAVTLLFVTCFASIIGHDVQPYGWAATPLAVGYLLSLVAALWISQVVRISEERREALVALEESREALAEASRQMGIETERGRVAQEIHDGVTQRLFVIRLLQESTLAKLPDDPEDPAIATLRLAHDQTVSALGELREFLASKQTPAGAVPTTDLVEAIESCVQGTRAGADLDVRLTVGEGLPTTLSDATTVSFVRAVREALNNVVRHAHARHASVTLAMRDGGVSVVVQDDGVGIGQRDAGTPPSGHGFGLPGLKARVAADGGRVEVTEVSTGGTRVVAWMPAAVPDEQVRDVDG